MSIFKIGCTDKPVENVTEDCFNVSTYVVSMYIITPPFTYILNKPQLKPRFNYYSPNPPSINSTKALTAAS